MLGIFRSIKRVYYDIKRGILLSQTVKTHRNDPEWAEFRLRVDWIFRVYTVFVLTKQELGEGVEVTQTHLKNKASDLGRYLDDCGFTELLRPPHILQYGDTISWVVIYEPRIDTKFKDLFNIALILGLLGFLGSILF